MRYSILPGTKSIGNANRSCLRDVFSLPMAFGDAIASGAKAKSFSQCSEASIICFFQKSTITNHWLWHSSARAYMSDDVYMCVHHNTSTCQQNDTCAICFVFFCFLPIQNGRYHSHPNNHGPDLKFGRKGATEYPLHQTQSTPVI